MLSRPPRDPMLIASDLERLGFPDYRRLMHRRNEIERAAERATVEAVYGLAGNA